MSTAPSFDATLPLLQRAPLFGGVPDRHLALVWDHADFRTLAAGETLVREGDAARSMFLVLSGRIAVIRHGARLGTFGPGDCVGEMALIDIQPRSADLVAITELCVMELGFEDLLLQDASLETYAIIVLNLARELSRRLRKANAALLAAGLPGVH